MLKFDRQSTAAGNHAQKTSLFEVPARLRPLQAGTLDGADCSRTSTALPLGTAEMVVLLRQSYQTPVPIRFPWAVEQPSGCHSGSDKILRGHLLRGWKA